MNTFLSLFAGFAMAFGVSTASIADSAPMEIEGAVTVDAEGVIDLIMSTPDLIILDTRRQADFDNGHIEGAVRLLNTDIESSADIAAHVSSLEDPILFYCNGLNCGRASDAVRKALEFGYTNIHYYALGMAEWRELGLPLITN